jgi:hypothetical protein
MTSGGILHNDDPAGKLRSLMKRGDSSGSRPAFLKK